MHRRTVPVIGRGDTWGLRTLTELCRLPSRLFPDTWKTRSPLSEPQSQSAGFPDLREHDAGHCARRQEKAVYGG